MFRRPAEFSGLDFCQVFPGGIPEPGGRSTFCVGQSHLRDARAGGEAQLSGQLAAGASKTVISTVLRALNNNGDEVALIGGDGIERHRVSYTRDQVFQGQEIHF